MSLSLQEVVAPLEKAEFLSLLRARSLMFRRSSGQTPFKGLFDWTALREMIDRGAVPPSSLRVHVRAEPVPEPFYVEDGKVSASKLTKLLSAGASVVAVPLQPHFPVLDELCADIMESTGETTKIGAIISTGADGALKLHYDEEDLILIQLEGSKRWQIFGPPVPNPVSDMPQPPRPEGSPPVFDEGLRPGDFLFLPAGHWHRCDNGPELSLHVGIFFSAPTGCDMTSDLLRQIAAEDMFRVPLTRLGDSTTRARFEAAIKDRLIEKIRQMPSMTASPTKPGSGF